MRILCLCGGLDRIVFMNLHCFTKHFLAFYGVHFVANEVLRKMKWDLMIWRSGIMRQWTCFIVWRMRAHNLPSTKPHPPMKFPLSGDVANRRWLMWPLGPPNCCKRCLVECWRVTQSPRWNNDEKSCGPNNDRHSAEAVAEAADDNNNNAARQPKSLLMAHNFSLWRWSPSVVLQKAVNSLTKSSRLF